MKQAGQPIQNEKQLETIKNILILFFIDTIF